MLLKPVPGQLLRPNHRLLDSAPLRPSLEKQVDVVWHEAVRKDCNGGALGCLEKMRSNRADDLLGHEVGPPQISANGPGKGLCADVGDVWMPRRVSTSHGDGHSRSHAIASPSPGGLKPAGYWTPQ